MIQKFSFDFKDRYFDFDGVSFAFRISTLENVYGPDPDQTTTTEERGGIRIEAKSLQYAGGAKARPGSPDRSCHKSAR